MTKFLTLGRTGGLLIAAGVLAACETVPTAQDRSGDGGVSEAALTQQSDPVPGKLSHICDIDGNPLPDSPDHKLIGVYDGDWGGELGQTVIIYAVEGDRVMTYYANGALPERGIDSPGCTHVLGKLLAENEVELETLPSGGEVSYILSNDGDTLYGSYRSDDVNVNGTFRRVAPADVPPAS